MSKKILLVEGDSDKKFFTALQKKCHLDVEVTVSTPMDYSKKKNGKMNGFKLLPQLMRQMDDGSITHLGMVVDADYNCSKWGYVATLARIKNIIDKFGYSLVPEKTCSGLLFIHSDGFSPFGLWVMPDNSSEGMLEDWVKAIRKDQEADLMDYALTIVDSLQQPKFKPIHKSKAEIATWLAWQEIPGQDIGELINPNTENEENSLLNLQHEKVENLISWLKTVYS